MNNLVILTLVVIYFKIASSLPLTPNPDDTSESLQFSQHSNKPSIPILESSSFKNEYSNRMQPRDILFDMLGPPLRNLTSFLAGNLYAMSYAFLNRPPPNPLQSEGNVLTGTLSAYGHQIGLGNGSTLEPLQNSKIAEGIPVQPSRRSVLINGENGNILVNRVVKYYDDEMLKKGVVQVRIRNGDFYVNNNLVMRKNPYMTGNTVIHSLDYENVSRFALEIGPKGFLYYNDNNRKGFSQINYRPVRKYV